MENGYLISCFCENILWVLVMSGNNFISVLFRQRCRACYTVCFGNDACQYEDIDTGRTVVKLLHKLHILISKIYFSINVML